MGLIVDNFAGGGGASTGIEAALGRAVDIAINHDEEAIRMHEANHPGTRHIRNNIWQVDPRDVTGGEPVDLAWFSPDCKHFSKAKGGKPREKSIRDLAWVVVLWAQRVKPALILLENVEEFRTWGPLCEKGKPIKERNGETFDKWCRELRKAGYKLQFRELRACDYGAPTIRKRFFMVARCDGEPIAWPEPTHGAPDSPEVLAGHRKPWRTAADIIDWSIPCPSIFDTSEEIKQAWGVKVKRPLAEKTLRRIAHGIVKFVLKNPQPFIVATDFKNTRASRVFGMDEPTRTQTAQNATALVVPHVTKFRNGATGHAADEPLATVTANSFVKRPGGSAPLGIVAAHMQKFTQNGAGVEADEPVHTVMAGAPRHALAVAHMMQANGGPRNETLPGRAADTPISTIATKGSQQQLVTSQLVKMKKDCVGQAADQPLETVTTRSHMAEVRAFLIKYYGNESDGHSIDGPLGTVTVNDRFGLVTVTIAGEEWVIVDIGLRMLTPRELFAAQGFPPDYIIEHDAQGRKITKTAQVAKCGNSVCPPLAEALVRANAAECRTQAIEAA